MLVTRRLRRRVGGRVPRAGEERGGGAGEEGRGGGEVGGFGGQGMPVTSCDF